MAFITKNYLLNQLKNFKSIILDSVYLGKTEKADSAKTADVAEEWKNKPTWIGSEKPTYTASDVGALPNTTKIPSGEAASKDVDTEITDSSTSLSLPTSKAVASFVEGKGYKTTDTTYTAATTNKDGLMTSTDKTNLDNVVNNEFISHVKVSRSVNSSDGTETISFS